MKMIFPQKAYKEGTRSRFDHREEGEDEVAPVPLQSLVNTPKGILGAKEFGVKSKTKTRIKPYESTRFQITNYRQD